MNKEQLLELIVDYGVESLRVGSYEARVENMSGGEALKWKLYDIRMAREKCLLRVKQELHLLFTSTERQKSLEESMAELEAAVSTLRKRLV